MPAAHRQQVVGATPRCDDSRRCSWNARMTEPHKCRWFTFSLRTLFVIVTVSAAWIGYELNWIRQRHELISRQAHLLFTSQEVDARDEGSIAWAIEQVSGDRVAPVTPTVAPGLLGLFCERGLNDLALTVQIDESNKLSRSSLAEIARAKRLFPEAKISLFCRSSDGTGMQEVDMPR
jgi:hypothetical protein